jgi:GAG-pre-integrase domain
VVTTGSAKDTWDSIQAEWGKSTDMRHSHAQETLNRTEYTEGTDIQEHIKLLRTRRAAVDNLCTQVMSDETWRGVIIHSIPPTMKWLPVIPSLYSMTTSADIISTLFAHGMILGRGATTRTSNTVLAARTTEGCTNLNCKAKKRLTHITSNCYWPGGGKEGQFPPNFGQRAKANTTTATTITANSSTNPTTTTSTQSDHFVLSAQTFTTPGQSGVIVDTPLDYPSMALVSKSFQVFGKGKLPTFLDSGASDTMFVSKESFVDYKPIKSRVGNSAKAKDGDFEIVGEGNVVQWYLIDGKEHKITYTHALHTPTLNANIVSISALDRAGLTTIFGGGKGITRKPDGTVVLAGKNVNGMYILETLNEPKHIPQALISLSHGTSLEQWHRRLTHCSPLTIREMASNNMVDGLRISDDDLKGKCEDCIMGRQTRRLFDGEMEKNLDPLDLVSFDLWGPSRTQSAGGKVYLIIIVDAGTSHKHGAYLADKSDSSTLEAFDIFRSQSETTTGRKIC